METKTKKWFSSHEAAKKIQPDWTHKKLCDLLIELVYIKTAKEKLENFPSMERVRYSKYELGEKIYYSEFDITEDFLKILIAGFKKVKKEVDFYFTREGNPVKEELSRLDKCKSKDLKKTEKVIDSIMAVFRINKRRIRLIYGLKI
jgi:hypothetical protein